MIKINKKGTKCYIYFDEIKIYTAKDTLEKLSGLTLSQSGCPTIDEDTGEATNINDGETTQALLCKGKDDYGDTYYFRGSKSGIKNWVKFANKYWRIIRINGNGTIRLIYIGNNASGNGIAKSNIMYNDYDHYQDNTYVGFKYGTAGASKYDDTHTNVTKSYILTELDTWYLQNLSTYGNDIDGGTGFCNDRTPYQYNGVSATSQPDTTKYGFGKVKTYYGPNVRTFISHKPIFKCPQTNNDLFTTTKEKGIGNGALENPIGLITADEVMYAGAYEDTTNTDYYLHSGQYYWTMSPFTFNSEDAFVFIVEDYGELNSCYSVYDESWGMRPVINLKSNLNFTGNGTTSSPFEIVE